MSPARNKKINILSSFSSLLYLTLSESCCLCFGVSRSGKSVETFKTFFLHLTQLMLRRKWMKGLKWKTKTARVESCHMDIHKTLLHTRQGHSMHKKIHFWGASRALLVVFSTFLIAGGSQSLRKNT